MKPFKYLLAFLLLADVAHGQTLADLQKTAMENRQLIKRYEINLEKSSKDVGEARSAYYPSVDLGYTMNSLKDESFYEDRENSIVTGAVSWNLFAGFKDKYSLKSAKLLQKAQEYRLDGIRQDIKLRVALHYVSLFSRKANLQVAGDYVAALNKMYQDTENRYEVGLIKKNDLLKVKVDMDNALIDMKRAEAEVKKGVQFLQREISDTVQFDALTFAEFDQLPLSLDPGQYEKDMLKQRSEIRVLKEIVQAADAQIKAQYAGYYPKVDLVGTYSKYDDDFINGRGSDSVGGFIDEEVRAQLVLSMNIFDGFGKSSRTGRARLEKRGLLSDLAELENELKTQLVNLFLDYDVSAENLVVARDSIRQAEENLRVTTLSYDEGLATEAERLDAAANLSRARFNYVAAKSEVFANYYKIIRTVEGF